MLSQEEEDAVRRTTQRPANDAYFGAKTSTTPEPKSFNYRTVEQSGPIRKMDARINNVRTRIQDSLRDLEKKQPTLSPYRPSQDQWSKPQTSTNHQNRDIYDELPKTPPTPMANYNLGKTPKP